MSPNDYREYLKRKKLPYHLHNEFDECLDIIGKQADILSPYFDHGQPFSNSSHTPSREASNSYMTLKQKHQLTDEDIKKCFRDS
jgi:hypothetical protein